MGDQANSFAFVPQARHAMRTVDQIEESVKAGFARENVEFKMAPSAYRSASGVDREFQAGAREAWRQKFLERLFHLYREEVDDRLSQDNDASYAAFL